MRYAGKESHYRDSFIYSEKVMSENRKTAGNYLLSSKVTRTVTMGHPYLFEKPLRITLLRDEQWAGMGTGGKSEGYGPRLLSMTI
jgi:hypothetical protein